MEPDSPDDRQEQVDTAKLLARRAIPFLVILVAVVIITLALGLPNWLVLLVVIGFVLILLFEA